MRIGLWVLLMFSSVVLWSQPSKLHIQLDTSSYFESDVLIGNTSDILIGKKATYSIDSLIAVLFYEQPNHSIQAILKQRGVSVVDHFSNPVAFAEQRQLILKEANLYNDPKGKSGASKIWQVAGSVFLTSSIVLFVSDVPSDFTLDDYNRRTGVVKRLALTGGLCLSVGFLII